MSRRNRSPIRRRCGSRLYMTRLDTCPRKRWYDSRRGSGSLVLRRNGSDRRRRNRPPSRLHSGPSPDSWPPGIPLECKLCSCNRWRSHSLAQRRTADKGGHSRARSRSHPFARRGKSLPVPLRPRPAHRCHRRGRQPLQYPKSRGRSRNPRMTARKKNRPRHPAGLPRASKITSTERGSFMRLSVG
jgi:hypothetical protein